MRTNAHCLTVSLLDDSKLLMYTGVTRKVFESLLTWLQPVIQPKRCPPLELTFFPSQKLLMVLMKLRHNFPQSDLAFRFGVDQSNVSRVLQQWIPMLAMHLNPLIQWPSTSIGPTSPPYDVLPNSVGII